MSLHNWQANMIMLWLKWSMPGNLYVINCILFWIINYFKFLQLLHIKINVAIELIQSHSPTIYKLCNFLFTQAKCWVTIYTIHNTVGPLIIWTPVCQSNHKSVQISKFVQIHSFIYKAVSTILIEHTLLSTLIKHTPVGKIL